MTVRCIDIVCDSQDKSPPKMSNKLVVQRLHSLERDCQPTADARGLSATIWVAYSVFSSAVNHLADVFTEQSSFAAFTHRQALRLATGGLRDNEARMSPPSRMKSPR